MAAGGCRSGHGAGGTAKGRPVAQRIFIIEDDPSLRDECARLLELSGYEAQGCTDFSRAADEAVAADPACVLLDLKLPGADGLAICRALRSRSDVPIVILTSSDSEFDEVMGINLGADDYVTKPYAPAVLLARVAAAIRRAHPDADALSEWQGLTLDSTRSQVSYDGATRELSRNELRILAALMRARGAIVSRSDLVFELWQSDEFVDDNTLTVNINRLRKSLASIGVPKDILKTHRGQGYSL